METILLILFVLVAVPTMVFLPVGLLLMSIPKEKSMEEMQRDMMNTQTYRMYLFWEIQSQKILSWQRKIEDHDYWSSEWVEFNEELDKTYKPWPN